MGHSHHHHQSHDHNHDHHHEEQKWYKDPTSRNMGIMTIMVSVFFFIELFAGIAFGSLSLLSDAMHMMSDAGALVVALGARQLSKRTSSSRLTFGFARAETLGGVYNAVFLIAVCVFIIVEAFERFLDPPGLKNPLGVAFVGLLGLIMNVVGLFLFHDHGHGHHHSDNDPLLESSSSTYGTSPNISHSEEHGHGHSHGGHSHEVAWENMNVRSIFLHVLGDALANVSVILAGLCVYFFDGDWTYYVDPLASLIISVLILKACIPLVHHCSMLLLQAAPVDLDQDELERRLENIAQIHELHIWELADKVTVCTLHASIQPSEDHIDISRRLKAILHSFKIHSSTIQVEVGPLERCNLLCSHNCEEPKCCKRSAAISAEKIKEVLPPAPIATSPGLTEAQEPCLL